MVQAASNGAADAILLTYKDSVTIRQADLDTLRDGYWLNDAVMSLYLDYMVDQKTPDTGLPAGSVHALDSVAANGMLLCGDDDEDLVDMFGPLRLEEKQVVICPLNDASNAYGGGTHWAMLFVVRTNTAG